MESALIRTQTPRTYRGISTLTSVRTEHTHHTHTHTEGHGALTLTLRHVYLCGRAHTHMHV